MPGHNRSAGGTQRMARGDVVADARQISEPYMIISIDFGTTFSGVCWTWSGDLDHVHTILSWEGAPDSAKVPTRIQYQGNVAIAWGFDAKDSPSTFGWFKLILDYDALPASIQQSQRVQRAHRALEDWSSSDAASAAKKITTDYLERLWRRAIDVIVNEHGQTWVDGMHCKVVVTKPAIWSLRATTRTKKAAERAIHRNKSPFDVVEVTMVSEPEAAAQAILQAPSIARRPDVTGQDDVYVICDAGGGTVDVISYIVRSLRPMKLEECVRGQGDLCGAIFIDDEFERCMRGCVRPRHSWDHLPPDVHRRVMENYWERGIKRQFDPTKSLPWTVDVPGHGSYTLDQNTVESLFQPACSRASILIDQQVERVLQKKGVLPKAIILVGGMGSSTYLSHVLKQQYHGQVEVRHAIGNDPWVAVSRGAVMAAAEKVVVSRISRLNYGFSSDIPFDQSNREHRLLGNDRIVWDERERRQYVTGKMEWVVKKGNPIAHIRPMPHFTRQYVRYPEEIEDGKIVRDIWVCDNAIPPNWKGPAVNLLCTVVAYLDRKFTQLPKFESSPHLTLRVIDTDIIMVPNGNALDFNVFFEGRSLRTEIRWPNARHNSRGISIEAE